MLFLAFDGWDQLQVRSRLRGFWPFCFTEETNTQASDKERTEAGG
jgi:hypothetical protein